MALGCVSGDHHGRGRRTRRSNRNSRGGEGRWSRALRGGGDDRLRRTKFGSRLWRDGVVLLEWLLRCRTQHGGRVGRSRGRGGNDGTPVFRLLRRRRGHGEVGGPAL